jgi:SPP1 gp7 family putative phage head morphogenesis protein
MSIKNFISNVKKMFSEQSGAYLQMRPEDLNKDADNISTGASGIQKPTQSTINTLKSIYLAPLLPSPRFLNPARVISIARESISDIRQDYDVYKRIVEDDTNLERCLDYRSQRVISNFTQNYQVIPASDDAKDIEIKEFIETCICSIKDLEQKLYQMEKAKQFGFTVSELIVNYDEKLNKIMPVGIYNYPTQLFAFDDMLNLGYVKDTWNPIKIEEGIFIVHRNKPEDWQPYGTSLISSGVYWLWYAKKQIWQFKVDYLEKYVSPTPIATHPLNSPKPYIEQIKTMLGNIQNEVGFVFSEGTKIEFLKLDQDSGNIYESAIETIDKAITILILGQTLTSDIGKTGSKAAAETHLTVLQYIVDFDTQNLINTLNKYFIEPLVKLNFGDGVASPRIEIHKEDEVDLLSLSQTFDTLINKIGISIPREWFYETFGIPIPSSNEETIEKLVEPTPTPFGGKPIENNSGIGSKSKTNTDAEDKDNTDETEETNTDKKETPAFAECGCEENINFSMKLGTKEQVNLLEKWVQSQLPEALEGLNPLKQQINDVLKEAKKKQLNLYQIRAIQIRPSTARELKLLLGAMEKLIFSSYMFGRYQASLETPIRTQFAEGQEYLYPAEPFEFLEAMKFFGDKFILTAEEVEKLPEFVKTRAFWVSGVLDNWLVMKFYEEIDKAIAKGTNLNDFIENMNDFFQRQGVELLHPFRLETIFRTNVMDAYRVGRYDQMTNPAVKKVFGYWKYQTVGDSRVRATHASRNGVILPQDDAWWGSNYPGGFNCRCLVTSVRTSDVNDGKITVTDKRSKAFNDLEPMEDNFNPKDYWSIEKMKESLV